MGDSQEGDAKKSTISKIACLVNAVAKLHNFCIDEKDSNVPPIHDRDHVYMTNKCHGYVGGNNINNQEEITTPPDLAHSGEHFDGIHSFCARRESNPG